MQNQAEGELFARARALEPVAGILDTAADTDTDIYLVGGTVRDLILDRPFIDVDLAVDGEAVELATRLGSLRSGETRFGTLSVVRDGLRHDIARTRSERYVHPGALPEVEPAGIDADLRRRDFTVNAIALGLTGSRAGELIAPAGALEDLAARELSVLHDRSFLDDPTRLLRLARYAARLGFTIEPRTRDLAAQAISSGALNTISGTRIGNELRLLAGEADPIGALAATGDLGLPWSLDPDVTRRALEALPEDGRADLLVLARVFGPQHPEKLVAELDRFGFTATDRDAIVEAATQARDLAERLSKTTSRAAIARHVGKAGIATVALAASQGSPSQSLTWLQDLRHLHLQITGDDLIANGIPEGPGIGRALQAATDALMDGRAPDRDAQLKVALEAAG